MLGWSRSLIQVSIYQLYFSLAKHYYHYFDSNQLNPIYHQSLVAMLAQSTILVVPGLNQIHSIFLSSIDLSKIKYHGNEK